MYATTLPVTLVLAGALALINIWVAFRVGQARGAHKVSVGDGGVEAVTRRMRAHANLVENAAFVMVLVGVIELAAGTNAWLWTIAGLFVVARVVHPFGMDGWMPGRMAGAFLTMLCQLFLAVWAIGIAASGGAYSPAVKQVDTPREEQLESGSLRG